jgi:hypothetical protein
MVSEMRVGELYITYHDPHHPSWRCLRGLADFDVVLPVVNGLRQKKC